MSKLEKLVDDLSDPDRPGSRRALQAAGRKVGRLRRRSGGRGRRSAGGAAAAPAEAAEEQTEFTVVLTAGGDKKINVIKEVRSRPSGPRPEGSQGPGRRRSAEREGKRLQAGSRRDQEEARRSRRRPSRSSRRLGKSPNAPVRPGALPGLPVRWKSDFDAIGGRKSRGGLFPCPRRATTYAFLSNQRHESHARVRIHRTRASFAPRRGPPPSDQREGAP